MRMRVDTESVAEMSTVLDTRADDAGRCARELRALTTEVTDPVLRAALHRLVAIGSGVTNAVGLDLAHLAVQARSAARAYEETEAGIGRIVGPGRPS